jgi:hypothetical protein
MGAEGGNERLLRRRRRRRRNTRNCAKIQTLIVDTAQLPASPSVQIQ